MWQQNNFNFLAPCFEALSAVLTQLMWVALNKVQLIFYILYISCHTSLYITFTTSQRIFPILVAVSVLQLYFLLPSVQAPAQRPAQQLGLAF